MTAFVLVHGAWAGAHGFRHVRRTLWSAGHTTFTPSLTGIGERVHLTGPHVDLTTHVRDVVNVVLYEDLREIVLLGFSYGGAVVTGALDHIGDRVEHLVYLDAFVPADGQSVFDLLGASPPPIVLGQDWLVPPTPRQYDDPAEAEFSEARRVGHPIGCFTERVRLSRPLEEFPFTRTYVRATADAPDAPGASVFEAAAAHARSSAAWRYHGIATNHMIPVNRPVELAAMLLALGDQGTTGPMTSTDGDLLLLAAALAVEYAESIDERRVFPDPASVAALDAFDEPLPDAGADATETLRLLHAVGGPATVATTGPNYFGFVNGATLPVALATAWTVSTWDQNAALPVMSPLAATLHDVTTRWLVELLGLPEGSAAAFVTGATVANATCLAAARDALLDRAGWDVQADGLFGAPEIHVVVGERAHSTLSKSLGLVGLGRRRVTVVPSDDQGRLQADRLPDVAGPVLVCAQAGEVNSGAFDPFAEIADWLAGRSGWLHVDGAFGLWAMADPTRAHLVAGLDRADSWATDGHKWLNVTYDCGIAFVRRLHDLRRTFAAVAGYLPAGSGFEAMHHTPQSSQRARQIEVWSVLRTLGRRGVADLVGRACDAAATIAERLRDGGLAVLNDVVLNQVLVRLDDGPTTEALIAEIQSDGRIWCGPTQWDGATAMRISVSAWKTTNADAERAAEVILDCAGRVAASDRLGDR